LRQAGPRRDDFKLDILDVRGCTPQMGGKHGPVVGDFAQHRVAAQLGGGREPSIRSTSLIDAASVWAITVFIVMPAAESEPSTSLTASGSLPAHCAVRSWLSFQPSNPSSTLRNPRCALEFRNSTLMRRSLTTSQLRSTTSCSQISSRTSAGFTTSETRPSRLS
jgi:hypothetical protein